MKKTFSVIFCMLLIFISFSCNFLNNILILSASPENALYKTQLAEKLLIKLQNNSNFDLSLEKLYKYFDVLYNENTQFFSYNITELENLMDNYREKIILKARELASNEEYKKAVEFLESKSELFKDKSTINSLINHYSKFFIEDGLFYSNENVKVLSINKLISYPSFAFNDNKFAEELDNLYLTSKEFQNLLQELYLNDYILISFNDILDLDNTITIKKDLYLPNNKKPIILIFNNINYCENEPCFIDKFIVDSNNNIACFSSKQLEKNQISYNKDFIPIFENFVKENKDFVFKNARPIISFDKEDNILGYNILKSNPNYPQDTLLLKKIVSCLKDLGYSFAYGNFKENFLNIENQDNEILVIKDTIFNLFGNINIYISPTNQNKNYDYYYKLNDIGFKIFIDHFNSNISIKNNLTFISSKQINGEFLRNNKTFLEINNEKIYDHNNRSKLF